MGLFKKKKEEIIVDSGIQNSENQETLLAQKIQEKRRQLEKDKFLLEEERKQLDADDRVKLVERELEKIHIETEAVKQENKKRWRKIWIVCSVFLALGIVGNLFILTKLNSDSIKQLQVQEQELQKQLEEYTIDCQQQEILLREQLDKMQ